MPRIEPNYRKIPQQVKDEKYVDVDDEGYEEYKRPKWTKPSTEFQHRLLSSVGRKYFLKREERSRVIAIEKGMLSLQELRVASIYPEEWVESCIKWAVDMRRKGHPIQLMSLLNLICNVDRRAYFLAAWTRKNGPIISDQSTVV